MFNKVKLYIITIVPVNIYGVTKLSVSWGDRLE